MALSGFSVLLERLFGGAGGARTRVQKASTVGTTCLFCLLFNYVELRQTGFLIAGLILFRGSTSDKFPSLVY